MEWCVGVCVSFVWLGVFLGGDVVWGCVVVVCCWVGGGCVVGGGFGVCGVVGGVVVVIVDVGVLICWVVVNRGWGVGGLWWCCEFVGMVLCWGKLGGVVIFGVWGVWVGGCKFGFGCCWVCG
uniref:Uncharacterized protein n=1 Tax=Knipowitschia caucasica TaxID=637954 RepID=A0AAV2JJW4_KNICA